MQKTFHESQQPGLGEWPGGYQKCSWACTRDVDAYAKAQEQCAWGRDFCVAGNLVWAWGH